MASLLQIGGITKKLQMTVHLLMVGGMQQNCLSRELVSVQNGILEMWQVYWYMQDNRNGSDRPLYNHRMRSFDVVKLL